MIVVEPSESRNGIGRAEDRIAKGHARDTWLQWLQDIPTLGKIRTMILGECRVVDPRVSLQLPCLPVNRPAIPGIERAGNYMG